MPSVHETTLIVSDLEASTEFYETVVGLTQIEPETSRVAFDTGDCTFVLEPDFDAETYDFYGLTPPGDVEEVGVGVVVALRVDDVDEIYDRAKAYGAEILTEPRDADWDERLFLLKDPDGYVIDIVRPLDETAA